MVALVDSIAASENAHYSNFREFQRFVLNTLEVNEIRVVGLLGGLLSHLQYSTIVL